MTKFGKIEDIALALTVVCSILIGGAAAQTKPVIELEAAMTKEQVNGDLKAAVAAYQKIAGDAAAPRDVRAKALLHLAGCYEKLGQEAQKVYQQIVRDFADQPAAAQARTRLAALQQANRAATPGAMTQRKIEVPGGMSFGPSDTDGRRVVYWSTATKELIYRDLVTGAKRVVFKAQPDDTPGWEPSRDFSMVSIQFQNNPNRLAVIRTDGTGYRELIRDDAQGSVLGAGYVAEWSWDNRYLLVANPASNRLLLVSVNDGERRELIALKTGRLARANFSPDGRYVSYVVVPKREDAFSPGAVSRIFVMPSHGGEPHLLYEEPASSYFQALDWTADGRHLAIASMGKGKAALHLLPVKEGQPAGAPVFVRYGNIGQGFTTKAGAFIYSTFKPGGFTAGYITSLDSNGRPGSWQPLEFRGDGTDSPFPSWSPDGNQIVYNSWDDAGFHAVVRNVSTGQERELYHGPAGNCVWTAQQTKIFCAHHKGGYKPELLSITADSGESESLGALLGGVTVLIQSSRDASAVYYWNVQRPAFKLVRREIATGLDTVIAGPDVYGVGVSPDERWLFRLAKQNLEIRPAAGGNWKVLAAIRLEFSQMGCTPDGNWIVYHDTDSAGNHGLFRVATAGGAAERLGDFPGTELDGILRVSPDGRKLMVATWRNVNARELWSLENFVPPATKN